jgi:hypothetical protein
MAKCGMKLSFLFRSVQLALVVYAGAVVPSAQAGSATWNLDPTTSDWTFAGNWTPETVPNQPGDTATFEASNQTSVSIFVPINATFNIGAIQFNSGAEHIYNHVSGVRYNRADQRSGNC